MKFVLRFLNPSLKVRLVEAEAVSIAIGVYIA